MAQLAVEDIYGLFEFNPNFQYERVIGKGQNGVACLVKECPNKQFRRRLVVKRAIISDDSIVQKARLELQLLNTLRGAPHIVRPIVLDDFPPEDDDPSRVVGQLFDGPLLIMEHLNSGSLKRLIDRALAHSIQIPNRILWRIFLCLIRASIALAYPPGDPRNGHLVPETMWRTWSTETPMKRRLVDQPQHLQILHNDLHDDNAVFGELDHRSSQHNLVPILKMIDFGSGEVFEYGSQEMQNRLGTYPNEGNVFDIARLMYNIIVKDRGPTILPYMDDNGITTVTLQHNNRAFVSFAGELYPNSQTPRPYPLLDNELRFLIARSLCFGKVSWPQPTLRELLTTAEAAVSNRGADFYPWNPLETDERIKEIVQELILNADVDAMMFPYGDIEPAAVKLRGMNTLNIS